MAVTPYLLLDLPVVGATPGPQWATQINLILRDKIDAHDHSAGKGVPVRTSGLYVDSPLAFGGFDATALRSARFTNHAAPLALSTDLGCLFVSAGELYYRDAVGNAIQFTSGGALNTASLGAIGGDYSTSGASLFYTSASKVFAFESSAGVKAHAALGNLSITEAVASGKAATIKVPTGLAANYQLTLPAALPAATKIVTLDNTGALAAVYDVDGATLEVASNALRLKDGGVTGAKLATSAADASTLEVAAGSMRVKDGGITAAKTGAVSAATANTHVLRDANGRAAFATPAATGDAATKGYVDGRTPYPVDVAPVAAANVNASFLFAQEDAHLDMVRLRGYVTFTGMVAATVAIIDGGPARPDVLGHVPAIATVSGVRSAVACLLGVNASSKLKITCPDVSFGNGDRLDLFATYGAIL